MLFALRGWIEIIALCLRTLANHSWSKRINNTWTNTWPCTTPPRGDAWKLLYLYQRPFPGGAEDIGTWQDIFFALSVAAVIVNASLVSFTMETFDQYSETGRFWIYIGFQYICFMLQQLIMAVREDDSCVRYYLFHVLELVLRVLYFIYTLTATHIQAIPDIPDEIHIQQERQQFIITKLINKVMRSGNVVPCGLMWYDMVWFRRFCVACVSCGRCGAE